MSWAAALAVVLWLAPAAAPKVRPGPAPHPSRIDFRDPELRDVARFISDLTGKNLILSDRARGGRLTLFCPTPVTRAEAFRAFLSALAMNDLTVVGAGRFLKIVPLREAVRAPIPVHVTR